MAGGMSLLSMLGAERAVLQDARFAVRTVEGLEEFSRVVGNARSHISAEMFVAGDPIISHLITRASFRDMPGVIVRDGEYLALAPGELVPGMPGAMQVVDYGAHPLKLHSKAAVADGNRAIITTAAAAPKHREMWGNSLDFTALFQGPAAAALDDATRAAASLDPVAIRTTTEQLAPHGIFVNDPIAGVRLLRERQLDAIRTASERLVVANKLTYDKGAIKLLAEAQKRGVALDIIVPSVERNGAGIERMREAGIARPHIVPGHTIHGNLLIADDQLIAGTATMTPRGLARRSAERSAREMGFALADPAAIDDALRAISRLG